MSVLRYISHVLMCMYILNIDFVTAISFLLYRISQYFVDVVMWCCMLILCSACLYCIVVCCCRESLLESISTFLATYLEQTLKLVSFDSENTVYVGQFLSSDVRRVAGRHNTVNIWNSVFMLHVNMKRLWET